MQDLNLCFYFIKLTISNFRSGLSDSSRVDSVSMDQSKKFRVLFRHEIEDRGRDLDIHSGKKNFNDGGDDIEVDGFVYPVAHRTEDL